MLKWTQESQSGIYLVTTEMILFQLFPIGRSHEDDGLSLRASFIVDPNGVVLSIEKHSNDIGRNIKEILRKLQAAKFVSEHKGMVCPASWTPGGKTLKPGVELVGKI